MSLSLPRNIKDLSYLRFVDVLKLKLVSGRKKKHIKRLETSYIPTLMAPGKFEAEKEAGLLFNAYGKQH